MDGEKLIWWQYKEMKNLARYTIILLALLLLPLQEATAEWSSSGLEDDKSEGFYVLVEELYDDEKRIGLSEDLIQAKAELLLRRNGIIPREGPIAPYLYININTVGNAFSIRVQFGRQVSYYVNGKIYKNIATTWERGAAGTHGGDGNYVLQGMSDLIDIFINDYLKANRK